MRATRPEKCTVQMHALCRHSNRAMVPTWAPCVAGTQLIGNVVNNAPIQRLATMRLPWRQNTLRF